MTFTEAAIWVLQMAKKPLHFKEITEVAIEKSLLSHVGKNPEVTMGARLSAQVKKNERDNPLTRVKPGVFALADWSEQEINAGLSDRTPAIELVRRAEERGVEVGIPMLQHEDAEDGDLEGEEVESTPAEEVQEAPLSIAPPPDEEERHRAELSAEASNLFEPEDDDDQPIFGGSEEPSPTEDDEPREGRRRRRRRRGKRREGEPEEGQDDLPAYTVSDAPSDEVLAEVLEEPAAPVGTGGLLVVDQLASALSKYDPSRGLVPAQSLADSLRRSLGEDRTLSGAALLASASAENLARERRGEAPLFRVLGPKLGLFSWSYDKKTSERLGQLTRTVQELRAATVKAFAEQLARLPQRAFGELVVVLLERIGVTKMTAVKRPGTHGAELHFSGRLPQATFGVFPGQDSRTGVPIAVCVRRDAKDVGRERVTELRGALHHYDSASQGWLVTAGQVLSGAKEEAASSGGSPMVLIGRTELAELCVQHGVGVKIHHVELPVLDPTLIDALSGR